MLREFTLILSLLIGFAANALSLGFPGEESTSVGIYVKDLRSGHVMASENPKKALIPASITKAFTAATALNILGPGYRFETEVCLTGYPSAVIPGLWVGDILVNSCGDPTIDSELFKDARPLADEIAEAVKAKGITEISGDIIVAETLSQPGCIPEWEIDDVGWGYGAGLYGFNYHDNKFKLWPATEKTVPYVPFLNIEVAQGDGTDIVRGIFSDDILVYGKNPSDPAWSVTTTMNNPADVFRYALEEKLSAAGIKVNCEDTDSESRQTLCTHRSAPLTDILRKMMHESHNLYAEGMLRAIAPGQSRDKALDIEMRHWRDRGVATAYNKLRDGSGLARADRIQPQFLAEVLENMAGNNRYTALFPKVGRDGTVANFLKNTSLEGRMALKTGSMNGVQCYAGYKLDADGTPTHVVVIMVNSFFCQRSELRASIEKFLLDTFK